MINNFSDLNSIGYFLREFKVFIFYIKFTCVIIKVPITIDTILNAELCTLLSFFPSFRVFINLLINSMYAGCCYYTIGYNNLIHNTTHFVP